MRLRTNANALIFQVLVYKLARACIVAAELKSVLDIGCGNPQKLNFFITPFTSDITGIDLPENVAQFDVDFGEWIGCDIEKDDPKIDKVFDLIIAADVIEHLHEPKKLMELIKKVSDDKTLVILSTPAKETVVDSHMGHYSEFTTDEITKFLTESGFIIEKSFVYSETSGLHEYKDNVFCLRMATK